MDALITMRVGGSLKNKAFYLNSRFNWELKKDLSGTLCLVPTKK